MAASGARSHRRDGPSRGFNFTEHMRQLCLDMAGRLPELAHVDMERVAVSFCQTRKATRHGLYATLTPLRFAGGQTEMVRRGRRWTIQRLRDPAGREMLYLLSFYVPRFLDLPFGEKLVTVLHELWHISPQFDGDVRRFAGRCYAHSGSKDAYDAHAEALARRYLQLDPPEERLAFLRHTFADLAGLYGSVYGVKVPAPKLIPL